MKVRELIDILNDFYPEEEVTFLTESSQRRMQILGLNRQDMERNGCVTFRVDWSVNEGTIVENDEERAARERFQELKETGRTRATKAKDLIKKPAEKPKKPAKRGRPKKHAPRLPKSPTF